MTEILYHPEVHSSQEYVDMCPICRELGFAKVAPKGERIDRQTFYGCTTSTGRRRE